MEFLQQNIADHARRRELGRKGSLEALRVELNVCPGLLDEGLIALVAVHAFLQP